MFAVSKTDAYGSQSLDEQFLGSEHLNGRWCSKIFVWKYEIKMTERHYLWMSFHKTLEVFNGGSGSRWNSASMTWERFWPKGEIFLSQELTKWNQPGKRAEEFTQIHLSAVLGGEQAEGPSKSLTSSWNGVSLVNYMIRFNIYENLSDHIGSVSSKKGLW